MQKFWANPSLPERPPVVGGSGQPQPPLPPVVVVVVVVVVVGVGGDMEYDGKQPGAPFFSF